MLFGSGFSRQEYPVPMKPSGKTIQIFCPSGDPRGVRIAEITTRIVQAVVVPRASLEEAIHRPELCGVGVYLLFGESEAGPLVYIGEAEDCAVRFKQHNKGKDFWNLGVAIISRTGSFTKAHARLLEWLSIEKAGLVGRYRLENGNTGIKPTVPEWMSADVAEIFDTMEVLLGTLGFPVFERVVQHGTESPEMFFCTRAGTNASGVYTDEGFVVLKGSLVRSQVAVSVADTIGPKRQALLKAETLKEAAGGLLFTRDEIFSSPSTAASVVCGSSTNGWVEWKNANGQTLDEVYRQSDT